MLAVPNFSEGRDERLIERVAEAFGRAAGHGRPAPPGTLILDRHSDAIHERSVLTLSGKPDELVDSIVAGARACSRLIDVFERGGAHPRIGSLDVAPIVYLDSGERAGARAAALELAGLIGGLDIPAFLYGELASTPEREERAFFRHGGPRELTRRMRARELVADRGPQWPHPAAGATLITARPPLAAFNLLLDSPDAEIAREVAKRLREAGGGLPGVRAIGVDLAGRAQVSINVHDPIAVPLRGVVELVRELASRHGARPYAAEIVGLIPEAAVEGFPAEVPIPGFDPERQLIERRLRALGR
ncbi:MAG: glutamate formiminotransferase [Solirubrobacterales bacterium]|nr:glutamate formiminotransferase [Solirubrobacterales bacterium]